MGREIIVDEFVRDAFIYGEKDPTMGLLVGAFTENEEYYVAHLAQTLEDVATASGGECGSQSGSSSENEGEIQQGEPKSFTLMAPISVSHHAKQLIRMLPGGLLILGIYVIEPVDNIITPKYETILKNLITTLNKSLGRNHHYESGFGSNKEKLVFHFNPVTKKFLSKIIDGETFKTSQAATSFKRLEWSKLECEYDTTSVMHLAKPESGLPLRKNLRILMNTFHGALEEAKFLINGHFPSKAIVYEEATQASDDHDDNDDDDSDTDDSDGDGLCSKPSPKALQKLAERLEQERASSPLHILIDKTPGILRSQTGGDDFIDHLHFHGKISCVAFVPVGSSTDQVVKMLKQDILRSMASRIEMHCESLIDVDQTNASEEGDLSTKIVHEVPRRVYANLPASNLLVSDYLFPGEGSRDSIITFRDILSLRLEDENDIIVTKEQPFASNEELRAKGSMDELLSKAENMTKLSGNLKSNRFVMMIVLTFLIAALAIGVQFLLPKFIRRFAGDFDDEDDDE